MPTTKRKSLRTLKLVHTPARDRLFAMFASWTGDPDFFRKYPPYEGDAELGSRPWLPALSTVWKADLVAPQWVQDDPVQAQRWDQAVELLRAYYNEWKRSKA